MFLRFSVPIMKVSHKPLTFNMTSHNLMDPSPELVISFRGSQTKQCHKSSYLPVPCTNLIQRIVDDDRTYCLSKVRAGSPAGFGVTETRCRRPFPTRPKLAEDASARQEVRYGDQATE